MPDEPEPLTFDSLPQNLCYHVVVRNSAREADDPEPLLLGEEPIFRDGVVVGRITSGAYGHTLGRSVGMGYVENEEGVNAGYIRSGSYEIEVLTERYPASPTLRAPYDPKGEQVRA